MQKTRKETRLLMVLTTKIGQTVPAVQERKEVKKLTWEKNRHGAGQFHAYVAPSAVRAWVPSFARAVMSSTQRRSQECELGGLPSLAPSLPFPSLLPSPPLLTGPGV